MNSLTAIALALLTALQVDVAPDQPLNFVYVDDPLIIELQSDTAFTGPIQVELNSPALDTPITRDFPDLHIPANGVYWLSLKDLPEKRGYYTATITYATDEIAKETAQFCRVDRPGGSAVYPLVMDGTGLEGKALLALASTGISTLRIQPEQDAAALEGHAMDFVLRLDESTHTLPDALLNNPAITRFEIEASVGLPVIERLAKLARTAQKDAPITLVLDAIDDLGPLLEQGAGRWIDSALIPAAQAGESAFSQIQHLSRSAGYEHFPVHLGPITTPETQGDNSWQRSILRHMPHHLNSVEITAQTVVDTDVKAALADVNGLAHRIFATTPVGPLDATQGSQAYLYRDGTQWLLAFWSDEGTKSAWFNLEGATDIAYTDSWNNTLPLPEAEQGRSKFDAVPGPRYLSGTGGTLPAAAARASLAATATALLQDDTIVAAMPTTLKTILERCQNKSATLNRSNYLALLRQLPILEAAWHSGTTQQHSAVTLIAGATSIARHWATLEQERGEPFLDPLPATLSRCKDLQQLYLTGTQPDTALKKQRGEWLVQEISRHTEEALAFSQAGFRIEAAALAALAEWRANSLKALTQPSAVQQDVPAPEPESIPDAPKPDMPVETPAPQPDTAPADPMQLLIAPVPFTHTVASGENPSIIAQKYGVSTDDLMDWNKIRSVRSLQIGQKLTLYLKPDKPVADDQPAGSRKITHTVLRGDTPAKIAARYKVDQKAFESWNGLRHNAQLARGKKYIVYLALADMAAKEVADIQTDRAQPPGTRDPGQPTGTDKIIHTVKRGDNPYTIAKKYGVSTDNVLKWNKLTKRSILNIGDKLTLYVPRSN